MYVCVQESLEADMVVVGPNTTFGQQVHTCLLYTQVQNCALVSQW